MKILVVSTAIFPCPPPGYAGLELIAYNVAKYLAKKGHSVTLLSIKGSKGDGFDVIADVQGGNHDPEGEMFNPIIPRVKAGEWDIIIDHSWQALPYSLKKDMPSLKVMHVCHGMLPYSRAPLAKENCFVGVSKWHAGFLSRHLSIPVEYAYNGIDVDALPLIKEKEDYAVFWARVMQEKGTLEAMYIMREWIAKGYISKGVVVGEDRFVTDQGYVLNVMNQCDGKEIVFTGSLPRVMMPDVLGKAKVLLAPVNEPYREIFNLSLIEAAAMGTPTFTTDKGAAVELVTPETGKVFQRWEDILDIDPRMLNTNPEACRKQAERFGLEPMGERYEELILKVLDGGW